MPSTHRHYATALLCVLLGCSADPQDTGGAQAIDFFSEYATLECTLLQCDPERFDSSWEDLEECLEYRDDSDDCTVEDEAEAEVCLAVIASLTCDDLDGEWSLPSLPNCSAAISCPQMDG